MLPNCYVQAKNDIDLLFDFCYSAKLGAESQSNPVIPFVCANDILISKYNIVVGSVEECTKYFTRLGIEPPQQIELKYYKDFLGRNIYHDIKLQDIGNFPVFIKPNNIIKQFNGFVAHKKWDIDFEIYHQKIEPDTLVQCQDVIDVVSEYRVYVSNKRIIGCKHYTGNCLRFPDRNIIDNCFRMVDNNITNISYTLDFGILSNGQTILIEINDAWAIGNYGLEPYTYYQFIKSRWLQITLDIKNDNV